MAIGFSYCSGLGLDFAAGRSAGSYCCLKELSLGEVDPSIHPYMGLKV